MKKIILVVILVVIATAAGCRDTGEKEKSFTSHTTPSIVCWTNTEGYIDVDFDDWAKSLPSTDSLLGYRYSIVIRDDDTQDQIIPSIIDIIGTMAIFHLKPGSYILVVDAVSDGVHFQSPTVKVGI